MFGRRSGPTVTALDGVSLGVERGEVVGVAGPSGSGKSTLLHLLAALDTPTRGSVTLAGVVTVQALVLGVAGGALGVALTPPAVAGLNAVANAVVGFETLVRTPRWIYGVGFAIAVVVSALGAAAAGLRIASLNALEQLR